MNRHGKRQRIALEEASEPVERPTPSPPPPKQPLSPKLQNLVAKTCDREAVARDPVAGVVTSQLLT
jgi:hypothetical protein